MKYFSNILTLILILAVVCLIGCKRKSEPVKTESKSAEPNIVRPVKVNSNALEPNIAAKVEAKQIIATVNGLKIFKDDFNTRVEQQISQVQRQMPANFFEQYKKELGKKVLDEMIVDILLAQKVKQRGV